MLAGVIGYSTYSLSDDASNIVAAVPEAATRLRQFLRREQRNGDSAIQQVQRAAEELQRTADEAAGPSSTPRGVQRVQIEEPAIDIREYVMWGSAGVVAFAGEAVLIVFFVFFLLASGDLFKRKLVRIAGPSLQRRKITVQILDEINTQIERFLLVLVIASVVVGIASWTAFWAVGLDQAVFWAVVAGAFNSIPYFGPIIVSIGTAVVAFLQFGTLSMAATTAGLSLAITSLEGWVLMPMLARKVVRTNEIAVFVSLIFWSFVWGVWGTLLAVPMLVAVKAFCDHVDDLKPFGELLGE
jgi:predicted PurR-regulated permease PerM